VRCKTNGGAEYLADWRHMTVAGTVEAMNKAKAFLAESERLGLMEPEAAKRMNCSLDSCAGAHWERWPETAY